MSRRLPPLRALRAFEAAARHLSFTRAGRELAVTQAAISHQIRALEAELGVRLFRRRPRALDLTEAGAAYLPEVRAAFDRLAEATERLRARGASGVLSISVSPSFASVWLVPRLGRFRERHPEIDVRLSATDVLVDFSTDDVDVAIRYGRGRYPGLVAHWLLREDVFPVCSPRLRAGPPPLRRPEDLRHHVLLHDELREDWRMWLLAAGVAGVDPTRGPRFSHSSMVLQAAIEGQGVALGRSALAADHRAAGRLVKPFDVSVPVDFAYYLVYPEGSDARPKVAAFRDWVLEAAATAGEGSGAG